MGDMEASSPVTLLRPWLPALSVSDPMAATTFPWGKGKIAKAFVFRLLVSRLWQST